MRDEIKPMIALRTNVVFENTCKGITGESCVFDLLTTKAINRNPAAKEMFVWGLAHPQSFPSRRANTNNEIPTIAANVPR